MVCAFGKLDRFDQPADMTPDIIDGALLCAAHPMFDLGEGLFYRIAAAFCLPILFMMTMSPNLHQLLREVSAKALAIDWSIKNTGAVN